MESGSAGEAYFRWFYDRGVWKDMHYRGRRILKLPSDLWNYQEILYEHDIQWVVETGTRHGGSALFFADLLVHNDAEGRVVSVDVDASANQVGQHPRIDFVIADTASAETAAAIGRMLPENRGTLLLILDSDHAAAHVLRELEVLTPLLRSGDYLVVEDTCVNGHPVRPEFGPGPYEAVEKFMQAHRGDFEHDVAREAKFGHSAAPRGYYLRR